MADSPEFTLVFYRPESVVYRGSELCARPVSAFSFDHHQTLGAVADTLVGEIWKHEAFRAAVKPAPRAEWWTDEPLHERRLWHGEHRFYLLKKGVLVACSHNTVPTADIPDAEVCLELSKLFHELFAARVASAEHGSLDKR